MFKFIIVICLIIICVKLCSAQDAIINVKIDEVRMSKEFKKTQKHIVKVFKSIKINVNKNSLIKKIKESPSALIDKTKEYIVIESI
jgi:hypothetical protein